MRLLFINEINQFSGMAFPGRPHHPLGPSSSSPPSPQDGPGRLDWTGLGWAVKEPWSYRKVRPVLKADGSRVSYVHTHTHCVNPSRTSSVLPFFIGSGQPFVLFLHSLPRKKVSV